MNISKANVSDGIGVKIRTDLTDKAKIYFINVSLRVEKEN